MQMDTKFLFLMILTFLLATVVCNSLIKSEVFVSAKQRAPATAENCVETAPTMKGAVIAERCCSTTTTFSPTGVPTTSSTSCNTCEYAGGGSLVGCHAYQGAPPPGGLKHPNAGPESSSVLPPSEQSNNTHIKNGNIVKSGGSALKGDDTTQDTQGIRQGNNSTGTLQ